MKPRSAKNKGARFQKWVAAQIGKVLNIVPEKDGDIESRPMGQSGSDVILRGRAREAFDYSIECKNQETWSLPPYIQQAKELQAKEGRKNWVIFLKKNHHEELVVITAEHFFELFRSKNERN